MLAAIGFDDQAGSNASEIDNVGRYRNLSAKPPAEAFAPQFSPQYLLGIGHISTQLAGSAAYREATAHVLAARKSPHPPPQAGEGIRNCLGHRVTNPFSTSHSM